MSSVVLFVFEGERTEPAIVNSLQRFYLSCDDKVVRKAAYGFNIYKLFEMLKADDGLGLVGLLQEELIKRQSLKK